MTKRAMAIACHPDDIEFMMAGTLLKLKRAGYEIHYMNIANGSLGTESTPRDEIVAIRREEAIAAAKLAGAVYHESLCDDLEVFYNTATLARLMPTMREVAPEILLTHGPYDYMEDHVNAGRLAVSAAFCRGMFNFKCDRPVPGTFQDIAVYHSMPHSLTDSLRRPVIPGLYVDTTRQIATQRLMLGCHASQKEWLDRSQGMDAYIEDLNHLARHYGKHSGVFEYAEGWVRHNPAGFCAPDFNPLAEALGDRVKVNAKFEAALEW